MSKQYFTLIIREPGQPWEIHFGDYDRKVVADELEHIKSARGFSVPRGTEGKIIKTHAEQAHIDKAVAEVNAADRAKRQSAIDHQSDIDILWICSTWEYEAITCKWSRKDRHHNLAFIGVSTEDYEAAIA